MGISQRAGFSLLELLICISIVAALSTVAIPAMGRMLAEIELRSQSSLLSVALARARLRAVERSGVVTVCPSIDGHRCGAAVDWSRGWILFDDAQRLGQPASGAEIVERATLDPAHLRLTSTAGRRSLAFRADGSSAGSNVTLTLCSRVHAGLGRQLIVNNAGRLRTAPLPAGRSC